MKETNQGAKNIRVTKIWGFVMKWVIPIIIFIIPVILCEIETNDEMCHL